MTRLFLLSVVSLVHWELGLFLRPSLCNTTVNSSTVINLSPFVSASVKRCSFSWAASPVKPRLNSS